MSERFFEGLSDNGPVSNEVMEAFSAGLDAERIEIFPNSVATLSTVSRRSDGVALIFLPKGYTKEKAFFEAPRVILDALRVINSPVVNKINIEDAFREELKKSQSVS